MALDLDSRMSAVEAADHLKVSRHLVYYWRSKGHIKPVARRGRSLLYRLGDILRADLAMRDNTRRSHRTSQAA